MKNQLKLIRQINLDKIISFIFYLFIFLLPWQTIFIIKEEIIEKEKFQYGTTGIYLFEIILAFWITLVFLKNKRFNYLKNRLNNFILLFLTWSFLSIFWSDNKILSLTFSFHLSLGVVLFFLIQNFNFSIKKVSAVFLSSLFLQSVLGIYQFFTQSTFPNKYLGISEHPSHLGGSSVIENSIGRWLRSYGGMPHPNIFGGFLAISLILGILFYIKLKNEKNILKLLSLILLSVNFLALLTTFSRSAWLGFLLSVILIFIYILKNKQFLLYSKITRIIIVFLAVFIIFFTGYTELLIPRLSTSSRLEKKSINERAIYINESKNVIKNNFILGVGAGNYTEYLKEQNINNKNLWEYQPVHNTFLLISSELGIIGISLFVGIFFYLFDNIRDIFREKKTEKIFILSSLIILFISFLFDHWIWTTSSGLILFWLLLGIYKKENGLAMKDS